MTTGTTDTWFTSVRDLTKRLVAVRSVSPGPGEIELAQAILGMLQEDGLADIYPTCQMVQIPGDPHGRSNVFAYLPGQSQAIAIILLGHFDTVGTSDYGAFEDIATAPDALWEHHEKLMEGEGSGLDHPEEWMFGRGALDMKSGVATNIAIMRHFAHLAKAGTPPPISLVFAATPDEEVQSAGAMAAPAWLAQLRQREDLRYVGLINTDNIEPRFPGDAERPIYTGSVGKLLPLFYITGQATHVSFPYNGMDVNLISAELIRTLSMNTAYIDTDLVRGESTPPPVTLHQADLKTDYNVQTAFAAWLYVNVLTLTQTPDQILEKLRADVQTALDAVLARLAKDYHARQHTLIEHGQVLTYEELLAIAQQEPQVGDLVRHELEQIRRTSLPTEDSRKVTLTMVAKLWEMSKLTGPAVVICFAPPYYPHIAGEGGMFDQAVRAVANRYQSAGIIVKEYFPALSDLSYMQRNPVKNLSKLIANMPLWQEDELESSGVSYRVPVQAIEQAQIEGVVNIGPFGVGAHKRSERVHMPYSFETVPQMVYETILEVASRA